MPIDERRPILTLPKKKDERAEFLAFQDSVNAQKPRDGSRPATPEEIRQRERAGGR